MAAGRDLPNVINIEMPRVDEDNVGTWVALEEEIGKPFTVELEDRGGESFLRLPADSL